MTDPITAAARFLTAHLEWMRHRQEAAEFLADVEASARIITGIARGPAEQKYLGPCGAEITYNGPDFATDVCDGDVYALRGASDGRCRLCGATVGVSDRQAWLDAEVRSHAFYDRDIADAYNINIKTIRTWANRGQLHPHSHDPQGRPRYTIGDVLDLAAADAARRAETQARRARRKENAA